MDSASKENGWVEKDDIFFLWMLSCGDDSLKIEKSDYGTIPQEKEKDQNLTRLYQVLSFFLYFWLFDGFFKNNNIDRGLTSYRLVHHWW